MRKVFLLITLSVLSYIACNAQKDFPNLKGPYLGQKLPEMVPEVFGPEILQPNPIWFWHGSPVFSPDGKEMFLPKYIVANNKGMELWYMKQKDNVWTPPEKVSFSGEGDETNPIYSENGNTAYYLSKKAGGPLFRSDRTSTGWSEGKGIEWHLPKNTGWGWEFYFTKKMELYTELYKDGNFDLYRAIYENGQYKDFENLGGLINSSGMELAPFVDPNSQYLIFSSDKPEGYGGVDLYISFKDPDGSWGKSVNMGNIINTASSEAWPRISPDGKFFFFCRLNKEKRGYQPFWMSAKFIEKLKPENK